MLELKLGVGADDALAACQNRGLEVCREYPLADHPGGRHWHLVFPGRSGTLEISAWDDEVWVKVHPRRDGGWARNFARELAGQ